MAGSLIYEELDEMNEVIFVQNGVIDIGFAINKIKKYALRFESKYVLGAYNCAFNERSMFIYKCKTECSGYYLRKNTWKNLLDEYPIIQEIIQNHLRDDNMKLMK